MLFNIFFTINWFWTYFNWYIIYNLDSSLTKAISITADTDIFPFTYLSFPSNFESDTLLLKYDDNDNNNESYQKILSISFNPTESKSYYDTLQLTTLSQTYSIRLYGLAGYESITSNYGPPETENMSNSIDFGIYSSNDQVESSFTLINNGSLPITIDNITSENDIINCKIINHTIHGDFEINELYFDEKKYFENSSQLIIVYIFYYKDYDQFVNLTRDEIKEKNKKNIIQKKSYIIYYILE